MAANSASQNPIRRAKDYSLKLPGTFRNKKTGKSYASSVPPAAGGKGGDRTRTQQSLADPPHDHTPASGTLAAR